MILFAPRYIASVGIEIEAGLCSEDLGLILGSCKYEDNVEFDQDPSVRVMPPKSVKNNRACSWITNGEIKYWTPAHDLSELFRFISIVFRYVRQNHTCGNHVHLKLVKPYYIITIQKKFIEEFEREYKKFAKSRKKYVERTINRFCRFPESSIELEDNLYAQKRYFAINYRSLLVHNTLEVRILPHARDHKELVRNLRWLIYTIDYLISKHSKHSNPNPIEVEIEFETKPEPEISVEGEI